MKNPQQQSHSTANPQLAVPTGREHLRSTWANLGKGWARLLKPVVTRIPTHLGTLPQITRPPLCIPLRGASFGLSFGPDLSNKKQVQANPNPPSAGPVRGRGIDPNHPTKIMTSNQDITWPKSRTQYPKISLLLIRNRSWVSGGWASWNRLSGGYKTASFSLRNRPGSHRVTSTESQLQINVLTKAPGRCRRGHRGGPGDV